MNRKMIFGILPLKQTRQHRKAQMGHLLFWILHIAAIIFGIVGLIVTIPLHLIYSKSGTVKVVEKPVKKRSRPKGFELGRL